MNKKSDVCIIGGGMITQVQILPSVYQLQRLGFVGDISVCALNSSPLKVLEQDQTLKKAFPGHSFKAYPSADTDPQQNFPELFREVIDNILNPNDFPCIFGLVCVFFIFILQSSFLVLLH